MIIATIILAAIGGFILGYVTHMSVARHKEYEMIDELIVENAKLEAMLDGVEP